MFRSHISSPFFRPLLLLSDLLQRAMNLQLSNASDKVTLRVCQKVLQLVFKVQTTQCSDGFSSAPQERIAQNDLCNVKKTTILHFHLSYKVTNIKSFENV